MFAVSPALVCVGELCHRCDEKKGQTSTFRSPIILLVRKAGVGGQSITGCNKPGANLDKFNGLEGELSEDCGLAVEQHVPQVVHFPRALRNVRQLFVVYEAHGGPIAGQEASAPHELAVRMAERPCRQALRIAHGRILRMHHQRFKNAAQSWSCGILKSCW